MSTTQRVPSIGRLSDPSAVRSLQFGDVTATYVVDGVVSIRPEAFFPKISTTDWSRWPELFNRDGRILMSAGGLLIERQEQRLLIDTGVGPVVSEFVWGSADCGSMLDVLSRLRRRPEDIDAVAFTHLHFDHAGWAFTTDADGRSAKAFPRARYLVSAQEWQRFADNPDYADAATPRHVIAALPSAITLIADGEEIFPGVRARVTGGHTPGHTSYVITAASGERLITFGDTFHTPAQLAHPHWFCAADTDTSELLTARRQLLAELSKPKTVGFAFHFGDCAFGRLTDEGPSDKVWKPIPTSVCAPPPRPPAKDRSEGASG
jgi:glyoxylase-like metal-dependent hydrolase (beta-lactamase superfamily II)